MSKQALTDLRRLIAMELRCIDDNTADNRTCRRELIWFLDLVDAILEE